MKTAIFDLDGTLADINHRVHFVRHGNKRWDKFFAECVNDLPINSVIALNHYLTAPRKLGVFNNPKIIIVSGRSDEVRKESEDWLATHGIIYDQLIMRPAGDYTPDDKLKEAILDKLLAEGHEILFTVDDRQRVVDMWRRRGITCLQCAAWEEETVSPPSSKGLLTLMVGPSGAGKSSWLKREYWPLGELDPPSLEFLVHHSIHSPHIVSSDQIRADLCGNFKDQSKNKQVFAALHAVVKTRISHGLPTVVDATNIKAADRKALVELSDGGQVRYIVINRSMEEKCRDGGWRNDIDGLLEKHENTFRHNLKDILKGDGYSNVSVIDLR